MQYRTALFGVTRALAAVTFLLWLLIVLGDAPQVPITFPVVLENHEQFVLLFVSVVFLSASSLIAERITEMGE